MPGPFLSGVSMRVFLKASSWKDQSWQLLVSENSLPMFKLSSLDTPIHVNHLEYVMRRVIDAQQANARDLLMVHPVVQFIKDNNLKVTRFSNTRHRATYGEACENALASQELLLGLTFTFTDRSHAMMFKLAWSGGQEGVIEYKSVKGRRGA